MECGPKDKWSVLRYCHILQLIDSLSHDFLTSALIPEQVPKGWFSPILDLNIQNYCYPRMSLVLAISLTMLTVDKVKEGAWAISTAGGSSEWSPSSPLWEQMRATEWQCVRHQTRAGHHINHFGERIRVHQGHNLPVLPIFRPSHDLPIISCFRPFHGLPFPCHFSTSASQGPF